nr:unnamed protein product [Callosobruchus chinensis]
MRDAISPKVKLEITLSYLGTGDDSFKSLEFLYRMPKGTILHFVPETPKAISEALQDFIKLNLPPKAVIVADDAFPLKSYLMKPGNV